MEGRLANPSEARVPFKTRYEADEVALGLCLAVALHALPVALLALGAIFPVHDEAPREMPKPVIAASLLKLGKPIDPKKLPDRVVPRAPTAPKKDAVASREDPVKKKEDAGAPPPPDAKDSDLANLIKKTDPFAEDAAAKPTVGSPDGLDSGLETDPTKVRAGDMYAARLVPGTYDLLYERGYDSGSNYVNALGTGDTFVNGSRYLRRCVVVPPR